MRDLQFNYSIDGSITVRVDEVNVGYINYSEEPIVEAVVFFGDYKYKDHFKTIEEAKQDIALHFTLMDTYEQTK
jgi:hypothetical protein